MECCSLLPAGCLDPHVSRTASPGELHKNAQCESALKGGVPRSPAAFLFFFCHSQLPVHGLHAMAYSPPPRSSESSAPLSPPM